MSNVLVLRGERWRWFWSDGLIFGFDYHYVTLQGCVIVHELWGFEFSLRADFFLIS